MTHSPWSKPPICMNSIVHEIYTEILRQTCRPSYDITVDLLCGRRHSSDKNRKTTARIETRKYRYSGNCTSMYVAHAENLLAKIEISCVSPLKMESPTPGPLERLITWSAITRFLGSVSDAHMLLLTSRTSFRKPSRSFSQ